MPAKAEVVKATLNGLEITLDSQTGSIIALSHSGPGKILDAEPENASIIDMATPIEKFEPLRLASRFSKGAKVTKAGDKITIQWDRLGASREIFEQSGTVSAKVTLKASDDGKSIIMKAEIKNYSDVAVKQILFPDFMGLLPFEGKNMTMFRTAGTTKYPFIELATKDWCSFYALNGTFLELQSGGLFNPMILRWMDFGGLKGGMSLFPKRWGWDERATVMLHLSEVTGKLRLMCAHNVNIKKGQKWQSPEYVLTPHKAGWAKGMEPYRKWVKQNYKRRYPLPKHVREGLGYRTIWMCQSQPGDTQDVIWKFSDLPKVAKECKKHGIDELVLWGWHDGFVLPLSEPYPHLGTKEDMIKAVKQCQQIGVNVAPFISVLQAKKKTAHKYGLTVPDTGGWTYHTEVYPLFQPLYAHGYRCAPVALQNELWNREVLESIRHLKDLGVTSVSWDQYWNKSDQNMVELSKHILDVLKKDNPEATFSGEELSNWEVDSEFLDYTWNWNLNNYGILTSAFAAPRVNLNIEHSPGAVKNAFADNVYMNIFPSKPGLINGSAYISDYPELSKALKQCAKLRKQFLEYFTDGTIIGNCILSEECRNTHRSSSAISGIVSTWPVLFSEAYPNTHISSYVLPDKVLMIVINNAAQREVNFKCDLEPWLKSGKGRYEVKIYDIAGKLVETKEISSTKWAGTIKSLDNLEIAIFEFIPK